MPTEPCNPIAIAKTCSDPALAQKFIDYLKSDTGKAIFQKWGYGQEQLQSQNSLTTSQTMAAHGLKNLESRYSVHETIDRLEDLLRSKGIKIFARFDQAAEAQAVGLSMRPTELLIFGDPKTVRRL